MNIEINKIIGGRIKKARNNKQMSMEILGKRNGITYQQIQKYESGKNQVSINHLISICRVLDVSPLDIIPFHKDTDTVDATKLWNIKVNCISKFDDTPLFGTDKGIFYLNKSTMTVEPLHTTDRDRLLTRCRQMLRLAYFGCQENEISAQELIDEIIEIESPVKP